MKRQETRNTGNLTRVAVYIRVSTEQQVKKGDSLDEQKATCLRYVDEHEDMILQDIYVDEGISGQKLNREDFQRLLDSVRENQVDLIIFTKLDRWFRNLKHYLNTQDVLDKHHVNWLAVSQPFYDTTTAQGRAFVSQSMIFAELEAQSASERISSVFDYKYKHGEVLSGQVPLGYSIVDKHLAPNDDAEKVVDIFKYYDKTGNLRETTEYMEREYGIVRTTQNVKNGILTNEKYIGRFRDNDTFCEPIVPCELFDSVQRKLGMNIKRSQKNTYIFSGLIKCKSCSSRYGGYNSCGKVRRGETVYRYSYKGYRCPKAYPYKRCENRKTIREKTLEKQLISGLKPLIEETVYKRENEMKSTPDTKKKINSLNAKIEKLKDLYVNDLITLEEFKEDKAKYQSQIKELSEQPQSPSYNLEGLKKVLCMEDLEEKYWNWSDEEKRYFWRTIIDTIWIDNNRVIEVYFL